MHKLLLIAKGEYLRMVKRRSFLLATLGMPLLIGIVSAASALIAIGGSDDRPFGVVDRAGLLGDVAATARAQAASAVAFPDEATARTALEAEEITAFYVVPADYLTSPQVQLFYWQKAPGDNVTSGLNRMLRAALAEKAPADVRDRLMMGPSFTYQSLEGDKQGIEKQVLGFLLPLLIGMFFVFVVMGSAGYLLQAVTTEKENRMVEVMFTSVSPFQLIGGKAVGLMGVAFTQIGIWVAALVAAVLVAARFVPFFRMIEIDPVFLVLVVLYFVPTYALVAGMMIALGSIVPDLQQGQQVSGIVSLLFMVPFFFFVLVFTNPNSPLMVIMTLFPTTAFMTVAMRWGATAVPFWQLAAGWGLLVGAAVLLVGLAARVFRVGMLHYGQPLSLRAVADILRTNRRASDPVIRS